MLRFVIATLVALTVCGLASAAPPAQRFHCPAYISAAGPEREDPGFPIDMEKYGPGVYGPNGFVGPGRGWGEFVDPKYTPPGPQEGFGGCPNGGCPIPRQAQPFNGCPIGNCPLPRRGGIFGH